MKSHEHHFGVSHIHFFIYKLIRVNNKENLPANLDDQFMAAK